MIKSRFLLIGFVLLIGSFFLVSNVNAASILSFLDTGSTNLVSDDSFEYLINADGGDDTIVEVGDRLRGMFRIDQLSNDIDDWTYNKTATDWNVEFTAVFDAEVAATWQDASGTWNYIFKPTASFETEFGTGAMIASFIDTDNDFDGTNIGLDDAMATAYDSSSGSNDVHVWTFGFLGTLDLNPNSASFGTTNLGEGWIGASGTNDIAQLDTTAGATNAGLFNFALNVVS